MRKKIVAGNWKMNLNYNEAKSLLSDLNKSSSLVSEDVQLIIAPPTLYLSEFSKEKEATISLSGQNCSAYENGAYTGEVSASMLSSIGVSYCLVGHSERRLYFKESNEQLKAKVIRLLENNVIPIFCFGEVLEERESNQYFDVVRQQIEEVLFHLEYSLFSKIILAYEPVWAIGTGKTASPAQAQEIHSFVRKIIVEKYSVDVAESISILYGGSCKPSNAKELFEQPDIDGGLIGGAALKAETFIPIARSF